MNEDSNTLAETWIVDCAAVKDLLTRAGVRWTGIEPHKNGVLVTVPANSPDPNYVAQKKLYPAMRAGDRWNVQYSHANGRDGYVFSRLEG